MGTLVTLGACSERKLWAHDKAPWGTIRWGSGYTRECVHPHVPVTRRYTSAPCPLGVTNPHSPYTRVCLTT